MSIKWLSKQTIPNLNSSLFTIGKINGNVKNVIIALHGFGDSAANFSSLAEEMNINDVLWLFPQGPKPAPMSAEGAQWFSLFSDPKEEIVNSENLIFDLIENVLECTNLSHQKIFIIGFSQGASMALYYGLKSNKLLSGIVGLSGFILRLHELLPIMQQSEILPPVFIAQGLHDQVVFPALFYEIKNILLQFPVLKLSAKTYKIGHNISQEEMNDVKRFIEGNRN